MKQHYLGIPSKIIIVVCVLLGSTVESQPLKKDTSLSTEWKIDTSKKEISFSYVKAWQNDHNLALIVCDNYIQGTPYTNCELTVQTHKFSGETDKRSCKLLQPFQKRTHLFLTYSLTPDKVLITFTEDLPNNRLSLTFRIVDVTDCQSSSISIISENTHHFYFHKIVQHKDSFDLIYQDSHCEGNYCIETFDFNGNIIKSMRGLGSLLSNATFNDILKIDQIIYPGSDRDYDEGYFVVDKIKEQAKFTFWPLGTLTEPGQVSPVNSYKYANNSGIARVCWQSEYLTPKIQCSHVEGEGDIKNITIKVTKNVQLMNVYNLLDGEFILVIKIMDMNVNFDEFLVIIVKPDGQWKEINKINLDEIGIDSVTISPNGENEICCSFLISRDLSPSEMYLKVRTDCLSNEN